MKYFRTLSLLMLVPIALFGCSETPENQLLTAATLGDIAKVEALLNSGKVDVNYRTPRIGSSALQDACSQNHADIVKLLLSRGANPNIATNEGETALQFAAYHGYVEIAQILITAGADVNAAETRYGYTSLASAARNGHTEVIKLLLKAGADRNTHIKDGRTAIDLARFFGHANAVDVLTSYQPKLETAQ